jgi:hypothetical protein
MRASFSATGRLFGRKSEREVVRAQLSGPHHRGAILAGEALALALRAEITDACFAPCSPLQHKRMKTSSNDGILDAGGYTARGRRCDVQHAER